MTRVSMMFTGSQSVPLTQTNMLVRGVKGTANAPIVLTFVRIVADSAEEAALTLIDCQYVTVKAATWGGRDGIFLYKCTDCEIEGSETHTPAQDGIKLAMCERIAIVENMVSAGSDQGIDVGSSLGVRIAGNSIDAPRAEAGVLVKLGSSKVRITDNHITCDSRSAIVIGGPESSERRPGAQHSADDIVIANNRGICGDAPIKITRDCGPNVRIGSNRFASSAKSGALVSDKR
ncbi:right-handed parallel beta-helix repeat-containing protein [Sphingobium sp. AS12]|uniref:right-handed parallel beta-helix repeat-containing protein n=1 Tax=Sphingobium sp. AS12 TaxID=2849495 RepID=UPI001C31D97B|nr:right-handed parallel beta-helix repeat-containing protein [Sphingobium sp. AS12]MBV2148637.1 right-handed parallel beta-helix repeat-containing protein [Sphingobium sp. AS12]